MDNTNNSGTPMTGATLGSARRYATVEEIKAFRVEVDALIQKSAELNVNYGVGMWQSKYQPDQELHVHLIEAKMALGKCLEAMGNPFPAELADKAPKA